MLSFTYQAGHYSDIITMLNNRNYDGVVSYMMQHDGEGTSCGGLCNRRNQERQLFKSADYDYYNDPYQ